MPLGRADRQAFDVVAAPGEQLADADERPRLVLDQDRQRVDHADTAGSASSRLLVLDHVERGGARRDHREALLVGVHPGVDDGGAPARERLASASSSSPSSETVKPAAP